MEINDTDMGNCELADVKEKIVKLKAENKRLKERIKELTQGSDKKVDNFPL